MRIDVPATLDGERVDRVIAFLSGCSRSDARRLVDARAVTIDGRPVARVSVRVHEGDVLSIDSSSLPDEDELLADPDVDIHVVHTDEDLIIVDKAPGVVVHPGAGHTSGTLVHGLLHLFPELRDVGDPARPGIVHRLDRDTSGLMAVARTPAAYDDLVGQLSRREVERRYVTLVSGHVETDRGVIDAPLGRSPRHPTRFAVVAEGKPARTHYRVDARFDRPAPLTRLACRLETGRTHQIRVHLAAIGHPVVGDEAYGGARRAPSTPRMFLHARHLGLRHPASGAEVEFDAPLPPDLTAVLNTLD